MLSLENEAHRTSHYRYFLPTLKAEGYNLMIDRRNFFGKPVRNDERIHEHISKVAFGKWNYYAAGCLFHYPYFKEDYTLIAIDLSKQQAFDAGLKAIQQIHFTGDPDRDGNTRMLFILEELKQTILDFFTSN